MAGVPLVRGGDLVSAPVVHPGDVLRDHHGLHTVVALTPTGNPLVTDWTGQHPHPADPDFTVLWRQHARSTR